MAADVNLKQHRSGQHIPIPIIVSISQRLRSTDGKAPGYLVMRRFK